MADGGNVYFIPPEYYGGVAAGSELQKTVGNIVQLRELRRTKKKEDERTEEEKRRYDQEYENKLDELAITKANALASITGRREDALKVLQGRNLAPTDARIRMDPKELVGDIAVSALQTPAGLRTPEQQLLVRNALDLPQEFSAEQVLELAKNTVRKSGFELETLEQDATSRQQFRDALKVKGMTPGQISAQLALLGISEKEQEIATSKAQEGLYGAQAEALGQKGTSGTFESLRPFIETYAKAGMSPFLVTKVIGSLSDPNIELSPQEEKEFSTALQTIAANAAASKNPGEIMNAFVALKKAGGSFGAQGDAQVLADAFNALGAAALPGAAARPVASVLQQQRLGGLRAPKWTIKLDMGAATAAAGGDSNELERYRQHVSQPGADLEVERQNTLALQDDNPMKRARLDVLDEIEASQKHPAPPAPANAPPAVPPPAAPTAPGKPSRTPVQFSPESASTYAGRPSGAGAPAQPTVESIRATMQKLSAEMVDPKTPENRKVAISKTLQQLKELLARQEKNK